MIENIQENSSKKDLENEGEEINKEFFKDENKNEGYKELIFTEDFQVHKSVNEFIRNHYGEI